MYLCQLLRVGFEQSVGNCTWQRIDHEALITQLYTSKLAPAYQVIALGRTIDEGDHSSMLAIHAFHGAEAIAESATSELRVWTDCAFHDS